MTIRVTGMNSGLDTESIIAELASARSLKVQSLQKAQTKLSWKIDAWKSLNTKIYSLYSDTLSTMRLKGAYAKRSTTVSDTSAVSVVTGDTAVNGTQTLSVSNLAKTGYLTGGKMAVATISGDTATYATKSSGITTATTLSELGITGDVTFNLAQGADSSATNTTLSFSSTSTVSDVVSKLKSAGLNANFDTTNQRLFVSSKESGAANNFTLTAASDTTSTAALTALGLNTAGTGDQKANKIAGQDATIVLNGATFTSADNNFAINGLTYTALKETTSDVTITTARDTSGIYDSIKNFISSYDTLINEMDSLYNADDTSSYQPLTSSEKSAMSDTEVTAWEKKIKDSLLCKDDTLSSVANAMKQVMSSSYTMADGTTKSLSDFGIGTLSYFTAAENQKYAYHIDGNSDDSSTKNNADKLKSAIASDPEGVTEFFSTMISKLYSTVGDKMASSNAKSAFTVYNDKEMKKELTDYDTKISTAQEKLNNYVDSWYSKFSTMETALAKLEAKGSSISSLLG